jgi:hypothetical protein
MGKREEPRKWPPNKFFETLVCLDHSNTIQNKQREVFFSRFPSALVLFKGSTPDKSLVISGKKWSNPKAKLKKLFCILQQCSSLSKNFG